MPLRQDKKTLQGQVQPWRCDLCGEAFEPDLKGICSRCGRLCCPGHRAAPAQGSPLPASVCAACDGTWNPSREEPSETGGD